MDAIRLFYIKKDFNDWPNHQWMACIDKTEINECWYTP